MDRGQGVQPDPGSALLDLYDAALPEVYGYLLSRCGQRPLAEDLTAETFLAAVEAVRRRPPPSLTVAWLIGPDRLTLAAVCMIMLTAVDRRPQFALSFSSSLRPALVNL